MSMKPFFALLMCATVSFSVASASPMVLGPSDKPLAPRGHEARVTEVYDGDTFTIDGSAWSPFPHLKWKVRIRGIDTPEKRGKCLSERQLAAKAKSRVLDLLIASEINRLRQATGETITDNSGYTVWLTEVDHDKFGGRFDATVTLSDGSSLANHLIREGLARPYHGGKKEPWCKGTVRPKLI